MSALEEEKEKEEEANVVRVAYLADIHETTDTTDFENGNVFSEIAEIAADTMNDMKLEEGRLMIENVADPQYSKIVALIAVKTNENSKKIYINKNVMENVRVSENDKVRVYNIQKAQHLFGKVSQIKILPFEDIYGYTPSSTACYNYYLKPYFQPESGKNANYIVKKGEILHISGKRFQVIDFEVEEEEKKEEEKEENKYDFGLIANINSIDIDCDDNPIPISQKSTKNSFQVKDLTINKLHNEFKMEFEENKYKKLSDYDTVILLSKWQKNGLFCDQQQQQQNIVFVKGKKGRNLYCRVEEYQVKTKNDENDKNDEKEVYMNEMMKFNLKTKENDEITVVINRNCKRINNQIASRIFLTPILKQDINTNDDYNDEQVLIEKYLKPYFESHNKMILGENQIFSTFSCFKRMDFLVLEVEVLNDEYCTVCMVDIDKIIIEVDVDGINFSEITNKNEITFENDIASLDQQWEKLNQIIDLSLVNSAVSSKFGHKATTGILLHGAPGTGKTLIMQAISCELLDLCILAVNGSDIISTEIGESERKLKRAFKYVINNAPGILFIDEIDAIVCYDHIKSALIGLMGGFQKNDKVLVVAATNKIDKIDVSLRRGGLFDEEISFNIPDEKGRYEILTKLTNKIINYKMNENETDIDLNKIAKKTNGFVGADLDQLCQTAIRNALESDDHDQHLKQEHFEEALEYISPSSIKDIVVEKPNIDWDDIGGLEQVKNQMIKMIENPLNHNDIYQKYGGCGSRGCLLWGPPGNGKTFLAKAIATKCNTNFIYIKGPELLSRFHGGSEQNVKRLFEKARAAAPIILFFDELDALAPIRGNSGNSTSDRVVNQLLAEMDGIYKKKQQKPIFYLGATNRPDMIDPALKRPGRLEQMIFIDLPNEKERAQIFEVILCNKVNNCKQNDIEKSDYKDLSELTDGFSSADIKGVVDKAINEAVNKEINDSKEHNIDFELLEEIIEKTAPSVTTLEHKKYKNLEKQYKHQYNKKRRNQKSEYLKPYLNDIDEIKVFIFKVFGKNPLRAQDIYEFLVDPDNGGYETLNDLLAIELNELDDLCYDLQIKYGNKLRFKRAIMNETSDGNTPSPSDKVSDRKMHRSATSNEIISQEDK